MTVDSVISVVGRPRPAFSHRSVTMSAGEALRFGADDWRGELVIVVSGAVEIVTVHGARATFVRGDVLALAGLPVAALHAAGDEPARLLAVSRQKKPAKGPMSSRAHPHLTW